MSRKFVTPLVLPADPTIALQAATKQYVDNRAMTPGPTGPTGPTGPAGPQQQSCLYGANVSFITTPAATWTLYSIASLTLPYSGTWLVWVQVSIACSGAQQISVGIDSTNQWRDTVPYAENNGLAVPMSLQQPFSLTAGSHAFGAFVYTSVAGNARVGNAVVTYCGP